MGVFDWLGDAAKSVVGGVKDVVGGAGSAAKDMFTSQNAYGGDYAAGDYQYGRDPNALANEQLNLRSLGQGAADAYAGGRNEFLDNTQTLGQGQITAGQEARTRGQQGAAATGNLAQQFAQNSQYTPEMGGAGMGSLTATAGRLANFSYDPRDAATQNAAMGANAGLSNFSYAPSAATQQGQQRLSAFDAGPQTGYATDAYNSLRQFANQGPGPSAAEAQLKSGLDQNVAAQAALARSGRGAGENAMAAQQAQFQAADLGQRTNADLASLRANEAANWRGQQLGALNSAGQLGGNIEAQRQGIQGLNLQAMQSGAQLGQSADVAANQLRLSGLATAAGNYGQLNQGLMSANANAAQAHLTGLNAAANAYGQGAGLDLQGDVAQQQTAQNWGSMALQGTATAGNQNAAADQLYLSTLGNVGQQYNNAGQVGLGYLQGGTAAQAGYENAAMGLSSDEAARRAQLQQAKMTTGTQASIANQSTDQQRDQMNLSGISGALTSLGGLL